MRYMSTVWIALTLCLAALQSSSASEGRRFLERYGWWDGSWDFEAREGDEVTRGEFVVSRRAGDSHFVEGTLGTGLWGYDPQLKRWGGFSFASDGSLERTILHSSAEETLGPGVVETAHAEIWRADGTKVISEETWTYLDDNTVTVRSVRKSENGEELSEIEFTNRRRPPGPHRAMLDAFARDFAGTWTLESQLEFDLQPLRKGDKYTARQTLSWSPDKESLHLEYSAEAAGVVFDHTKGIAGWDAAQNAVVVHWFDSRGTSGEWTLSRHGAGWYQHFRGTEADGVTHSHHGPVELKGDSYVVHANHQTHGGKSVPDQQFVWSRVR
jgi:hypothetical protein